MRSILLSFLLDKHCSKIQINIGDGNPQNTERTVWK